MLLRSLHYYIWSRNIHVLPECDLYNFSWPGYWFEAGILLAHSSWATIKQDSWHPAHFIVAKVALELIEEKAPCKRDLDCIWRKPQLIEIIPQSFAIGCAKFPSLVRLVKATNFSFPYRLVWSWRTVRLSLDRLGFTPRRAILYENYIIAII